MYKEDSIQAADGQLVHKLVYKGLVAKQEKSD